MSNQQAIDEALDALEIENDAVEEVVEEVIEEVVEPVEEVVEEVAANPPGYIDNIDDWIAAGKDPDLFKGKKAYSAEYDRIKEIKELKETMQVVTDGIGEWKEQQKQTMEQQVERARSEAVAELERARADVDVDRAIEAQKKINDLDKPKQEVYKPAPVVADFFSKNPILDKNSSQFDAEVFKDASMFQTNIINELTGGNMQVELSPSQVERSLKVALSKAKALSPDKFVSPRNQRKAAPAPARTKVQQKGEDYRVKLKGIKSNSKNSRDTNAATEIYDMLIAKANSARTPELKAKAMAAAETYAKNV